MDLGLRETDPKIAVTTSSADNYFSEQALRAGLIANEMNRSELMMNTDPLREAIQREYEKERIREEIIASEIRRRELEAEVRRELAFERELALRRAGDGFPPLTSSIPSLWSEPRFGMLDRPIGIGFGMNDRLPFPARPEAGSFERLPFQRNHVAAKAAEIKQAEAGKVMHVAKPITSNLAGTKRKITAAEGANDSNKTAKKQPQEWNCALCEVSATSEYGLNQHLQGKKHKAKELKMIRESKKNKAAQKKEKLEVQAKKKAIPPDMKKELFPFWCDDCQIGCHSAKVLNNHRKGKKHMAREEELKQAGGSASSTTKHEAAQGKAENASEDANEDANENMDKEEGQEEPTETMGSLVDDVVEEEALKDGRYK